MFVARGLMQVFVTLALVGCSKSQPLVDSSGGAASSSVGATAAGTYQAKGVIKSFGDGRRSVKIAHEEIPGYMKAMTMPFSVGSASQLDGLNEGDAVEFSFVEAGGGQVIKTLQKR